MTVYKQMLFLSTEDIRFSKLIKVNGPYIQLIQFRTVKESVELLNNSKYGSCVSVFSQNVSLVMEVNHYF